MTQETQILALEAERDYLLSVRLWQIQRENRRLNIRWLEQEKQKLLALWEKLRANRSKPSPLKGRKILEDYECAVSTMIKRMGGIRIPKDLREEFAGWNRLHSVTALPPDELAEELHALGLIEDATTNALIDGLKSGRKSARLSKAGIDAWYAYEGRKLVEEQERMGDCPF